MIAEVLLRSAKPLVRAAVIDVCTTAGDGPRMALGDAERVFREAWARHRARTHELPKEGTVGGRLNVRLASLTLEFMRTLEATGYERSEAVRLTREIAWRLYRRWASIPRAWGRMRGGSRTNRMNHMLRAFLRFPFSEPSYRWDLSSRSGVAHLDVYRCPVADFFIHEGAGDVCAGTWCTLDYPLAEYWGGRYERDGTIAVGDKVCRMRWIAEEPEQ
ncbi:MAG: L-2-amino-thiazoline-4-carboxylic acid hydrolase [Gemmatimonadota bacterium]